MKARGYRLIAGVDEAGRGPLAGPVVAAAVILRVGRRSPWLHLVRDSKQLLPQRREWLYGHILDEALAVGVGVVDHGFIDREGIVPATRLAMCHAIQQLAVYPDSLLIDAVSLPVIELLQRNIIKGDNISLSIAAASIVAKVTRDRLMADLDSVHPGYGFVRNKGYGTPEHLEGLRKLGPCPVHRRSFYPVSEFF